MSVELKVKTELRETVEVYDVQLTIPLQTYLDLIRVCKVVRDNVGVLSEAESGRKFISKTTEKVLEMRVESADSEISKLLNKLLEKN
jgi:hypothetical protein